MSTSSTPLLPNNHHHRHQKTSQTTAINPSPLFNLPIRYNLGYLLITSQLLCVPIFAVTMPFMSTEFQWTKETQGHLHSSFFIGYAISGIPSGFLSDKNGAKWILFVSFFAMGTFIIITPLCCAMQDVSILIINRIFMGIAEGVQGPAILSMVNEWFPMNERSTALGSIHSGMFSGSIIAFILVPLLIMAF